MILAAVQSTPATNVAAVVCQTVLAVAGLAALGWIFRRSRREAPVGVNPWRASWLDFGIWLWLICFAFYAGMNGFHLFFPPAAGQASGAVYFLLRACVFQLSALGMQAALLWSRRSFSPAPVNRAPISIQSQIKEGAIAWLAAYPLIVAVTMSWQTGLNFLQKSWTSLETPLQQPVEILTHADNGTEKFLVVLFAVFIAPVTEELFFRAGIYRFLKNRLPPRLALVVASLIFAGFHSNLVAFLPLFVLGVFLAGLYERTGHIAAPIILHLMFNLAQIVLMFLFPDSAASTPSAP